MLAVCIIFLSSILFVFVATLYLEEHTWPNTHFFHNYNIVFDGHSLLSFSRGERSLEDIAPGEGTVCHLSTNSSGVFHYIF